MNEINNENKEKKSKSVCFTPIPINAALKAADDWLGQDLPWHPVNEIQKEYLEKFFEKDSAEYDFVKRTATNMKSVVQKFLAENGFPGFDIPDIDPKIEFYIAGIMNQIVEWLHKGKSVEMKGQDGNIYDAVEFSAFNLGDIYTHGSIDDSMWVYHIFKPLSHSDFVAMIRTKSDDRVYLTFLNSIPDNEIKPCFEMMELAQKITDESKEPESVKNRETEFINNLDEDKRLIIPKIDFEGDVDINWIVNMKTVDLWFIKWAKMKVKLKLNHIGARAQGVAVMNSDLGDPPIPKILKFDRPFMIWFTHQRRVTFVMYADYDCWADPGDDILI